jgi:hypothetical protein
MQLLGFQSIHRREGVYVEIFWFFLKFFFIIDFSPDELVKSIIPTRFYQGPAATAGIQS